MNSTITIQNLKCGGCANTITSKISALENISEVTIDLETSSVLFKATSKEDIISVKEKLAAIGYPEVGKSNTMVSKVKSIVSCASGRISN